MRLGENINIEKGGKVMKQLIKKHTKATIEKVTVRLACACPSNCAGCACVGEKVSEKPQGVFDAEICAGLYYLDKAFNGK